MDGVLDGLAAAGAHLADVLAAVLVLGQADDQRGAVVGSGGANLNLNHRVTRFEMCYGWCHLKTRIRIYKLRHQLVEELLWTVL